MSDYVNLVRLPREVHTNDQDTNKDAAKPNIPFIESNVNAAIPHGQLALPDGYNKFEIPKHPCKCQKYHYVRIQLRF